MNEFVAIATYLIQKRITSSQSMAKWFAYFKTQIGIDIQKSIESGNYKQIVRQMYEERIISSEIASYLFQVTLWLKEATEQVLKFTGSGISIIETTDIDYPNEFALIPDKPVILYCLGNKKLLNNFKVSFVGTRTPSLWGTMKAKQLAYESAACGITAISGFAAGIDSEIFEESLARNGTTIAILPQLNEEYSKLVTEGSLFISEFPPSNSEINKWQFIARNRLIAALGRYTILVEAPIKSGTIITADLAVDYAKDLYIVLPDVKEDSSYGGQIYGITYPGKIFIQSLYDVFYLEADENHIQRYKEFIRVISQNKIVLKQADSRHIATVDLLRILHAFSKSDLSVLDNIMVELHRFGIIKERKNKVVFNFSGYNSWPKI